MSVFAHAGRLTAKTESSSDDDSDADHVNKVTTNNRTTFKTNYNYNNFSFFVN